MAKNLFIISQYIAKRIMPQQAGAVIIEFAIILPLMLIMLIGMVEIANALILQERLSRTVHGMAAAVSSGQTVATADFASYTAALPQMMWPYTQAVSITFTGVAFGSALPAPCVAIRTLPCVMWQRTINMNGNIAGVSMIGSPGGRAVMPPGFSAYTGQNYVVAEGWVNYRPILNYAGNFIGGLQPRKLFFYTIYKPFVGDDLTITVPGP